MRRRSLGPPDYAGPLMPPRRDSLSAGPLGAGDSCAGHHIRELAVGRREAPRPQPAVRVHPDPARVPQDLGGAPDPLGDLLRGLDLVAVDVQDTEADLPGVAVLP